MFRLKASDWSAGAISFWLVGRTSTVGKYPCCLHMALLLKELTRNRHFSIFTDFNQKKFVYLLCDLWFYRKAVLERHSSCDTEAVLFVKDVWLKVSFHVGFNECTLWSVGCLWLCISFCRTSLLYLFYLFLHSCL